MPCLSTLLLSAALFPLVTRSQSADESPTGALLKFPAAKSRSPLYGQVYEVQPAQFGKHDYGGFVEGLLVLPMNTSFHTECSEEPMVEGTPKNEYIHYVDDFDPGVGDKVWIMLIDRGDCYFVDKVENAQRLGASAVIVIDNKDEGLRIMWPPENYEDVIDIPSVMIRLRDAEVIMSALGVQGYDPDHIEQTVYPDAYRAMNETLGLLEWGLPHEDDRVEWELWTSSNDEGSVKFKHNFASTSAHLDYGNYTVFTPHYFILNGSHWDCDDGRYRCTTQCTNGGRYCAPDPEYDLEYGIDGMDVVRETLRQMCVWKYVEDVLEAPDGDRNTTVWWHYSILWDNNCFMVDDPNQFSARCSFDQMAKLTEYPDLGDYVSACITDSGGYNYRGGVNTLLASDTWLREELGIFALPSVIVNDYWVHGNIDCEEVTEEECQVLDAICAGYLEGTQPDECFQTPSPTMCSGEDRDCNGGCEGYETDLCGDCRLPSDVLWNSCVGCDRVPNSGETYDCTGTCGGTYEVNHCGYCKDSTDSDFDSYGEDCANVCNGDHVENCGACRSPDDEKYDKCHSKSSSSSDSKSITVVVIISVISLIVIFLAAAVVYRLYKRQQAVDQRFGTIMKTYQLMDENPAVNDAMHETGDADDDVGVDVVAADQEPGTAEDTPN